MKGLERREWTGTSPDVHTTVNPYCDEVECWCHTNLDYHEEVTHPMATEEQIEDTYRFLGLPRTR